MIGDYFYRNNAEKIRWIENCDVTYQKQFDVDSVENNEYLRFEGLDCYCDIYLNNIKIGAADDMFITVRIFCRERFEDGNQFTGG